jgi:hypothetical protein
MIDSMENCYRGERLEYVGDIILNLDYWDCDCEKNYIHPKTQQICNICNYSQEESPASRENEVKKYNKLKEKDLS